MTSTARIPSRLLLTACLLLSGFAPAPIVGQENVPETNVSVRVRVEWGPRPGGRPKVWSGSFETVGESNHLLNPVSLAIEADQPGRVKHDGQRLLIRPATARTYDGFDVTVEAPWDSELVLDLSASGKPSLPVRIRLSELFEGPVNRRLDEEGSHVWFRRAPGDALRVELNRDHLVFRPGERFDCFVRLNLLNDPLRIKARPVYSVLQWQLVRARTNEKVVSVEIADPERFPEGRIRLPVVIPPNEGVYDLRIQLLGRGLPNVERTIQLVVLELERPAPRQTEPNLLEKFGAEVLGKAAGEAFELPGSTGAGLQLVRIQSLSPTSAVANPVLPGFNRKRFVSSNDLEMVRTPFGPLLATGSNGWPGFPRATSPPRVSWVAFELSIAHPGKPHLLEVEYPDWRDQTLGISIVEPNAVGKIVPLGLDSGVYTKPVLEGPEQIGTFRMLFWPRTEKPYVLFTNRRSGNPAMLGQITLSEIQGSLSLGREPTASPRRMLGPYLQKPLFPENFGASEARDGHRSLDDWMTFYQGASRLVDYLHYSGQNSLALTVLADGSTIYPSRWLDPTPRHDTGIFFSTAQDPLRKDVLELVFSLFDREGLSLVPVLNFSAPLPELERLLGDPKIPSEGIELVGGDGRTWRQSRKSNRGLAPFYNPLDPRVQDAMRNVVREITERYGHHTSFAGMGIELSADGYALLPSADWGLDDTTVQRFLEETKIQTPPEPSGTDRVAFRRQTLVKGHRASWLRWRNTKMTDFYRSLRQVVVTEPNQRKLFLMANHLLSTNHGGDDPYQALSRGTALEEFLLNKGIDTKLYRDDEDLVLFRPSRIASLDRHPGGALDEDFNSSPELDGLYRNLPLRGALFVHEPYPCRLKEFDETNLWEETYTWLAAQPMPGGDWDLERYAHALASFDPTTVFDGGWMVPVGQELRRRAWIRTFLSIPNRPFQNVESAAQPVTVRTSSDDTQTVMYLVNDFPWSVHVQLQLSCSADVGIRRLGPGSPIDLVTNDQGGSVLSFDLQPFDLQAVVFPSPDVRVNASQVVLEDRARAELEKRFQRFSESIEVRKTQTESSSDDLPFRAEFEEEVPTNGRPRGWRLVGQGQGEEDALAEMLIDTETFHKGKQSLRLRTEGPGIALMSPDFPRPPGRVLGMLMWMRSREKSIPAKIAFEAAAGGRTYRRESTVMVYPQWTKPLLFRIFDLPEEELDSLHVRFELLDSGTVWIDDLVVELDPLTTDERRELTKTVSSLNTALKQERWADFRRLLDNYWARFVVAHWGARRTTEPARENTAQLRSKRTRFFQR